VSLKEWVAKGKREQEATISEEKRHDIKRVKQTEKVE